MKEKRVFRDHPEVEYNHREFESGSYRFTTSRRVDGFLPILGVEVGTTGYMGGDGGHGGMTVVSFDDNGSGSLEVEQLVKPIKEWAGDANGVTLSVTGDWELNAMISGLRWAADELQRMSEERGTHGYRWNKHVKYVRRNDEDVVRRREGDNGED